MSDSFKGNKGEYNNSKEDGGVAPCRLTIKGNTMKKPKEFYVFKGRIDGDTKDTLVLSAGKSYDEAQKLIGKDFWFYPGDDEQLHQVLIFHGKRENHNRVK